MRFKFIAVAVMLVFVSSIFGFLDTVSVLMEESDSRLSTYVDRIGKRVSSVVRGVAGPK